MNELDSAKTVFGMTANIRIAAYTRRGPHRSSAMPMKMRAGIVSATLQSAIVFSSASDRPSWSAIVLANGA